MAISRLGASSVEATTITIPGTYSNGDLLIIFAFRDGSTTAPSLPSGWTSIDSGGSNTCSARIGWKLAQSAAETSGTWTNATGLVCHVYTGVATNKTPIILNGSNGGATNTVTYGGDNLMQCPADSWVAGFAGHRSVNTTVETAPTGMTNQTNTVGATAEYAGHDSNGIYASLGTWPTTSVTISGTASGWRANVIEILPDKNKFNNYEFAGAKISNAGIMSVTEKIL